MFETEPSAFWLYVSRSAVIGTTSDVINEIVARSQTKNASLAITGALIFTGCYFSQYIEGPVSAVDSLRANILADDRHFDVHTLGEGAASGRKFGGWSLAYASEASPFDQLIGLAYRLQSDAGYTLLMEMIRRFTAGHVGQSAA